MPAGPVEPVDVVAGVALSIDRLQRFLHGPATPADRLDARRRLDRQADRW